MRKQFIGLALGLALAFPAAATDVYRWTDSAGRTHMSDRVPEEYRSRAVRVGGGPGQSDADRQAAAARSRQDQERLRAFEAARNAQDARSAEQARAAASAAQAASAAAAARRHAATADKALCDSMFAAFLASQDCWGRFRSRYGVRGEEALEACGQPVPDPSQRCGRTAPEIRTLPHAGGG